MTVATGVKAAPCKAGAAPGNRRAAALTAPAKTRQAIMATLNADVHVTHINRCRTAARPGRFSNQMTKLVNDLHTKAGSLACGIRR